MTGLTVLAVVDAPPRLNLLRWVLLDPGQALLLFS